MHIIIIYRLERDLKQGHLQRYSRALTRVCFRWYNKNKRLITRKILLKFAVYKVDTIMGCIERDF